MIIIKVTTSNDEDWTEPYPGTADEARAALVGVVVETEPLITIVSVERVDRGTQ